VFCSAQVPRVTRNLGYVKYNRRAPGLMADVKQSPLFPLRLRIFNGPRGGK